MRDPVPPMVRRSRPAAPSSPEVARARALYIRELRARVLEGRYFTPGRVDLAMKRMFRAIREDLPDERAAEEGR